MNDKRENKKELEDCKRETIEVKGAKQSEIRGVIKTSKSMQLGEQGIIK